MDALTLSMPLGRKYRGSIDRLSEIPTALYRVHSGTLLVYQSTLLLLTDKQWKKKKKLNNISGGIRWVFTRCTYRIRILLMMFVSFCWWKYENVHLCALLAAKQTIWNAPLTYGAGRLCTVQSIWALFLCYLCYVLRATVTRFPWVMSRKFYCSHL